MKITNCCLTIAGSDSSAGAGIQADLKTFMALKVYGCSVITCITAQNTQKVYALETISKSMLLQQLEVVFADCNIQYVKIGVLGNCENIKTVAEFFKKRSNYLILDPVMQSKSGYDLITKQQKECLQKELLPICNLMTPNVKEAQLLSGSTIKTIADAKKACLQIQSKNSLSVLVTGLKNNHMMSDILYHDKEYQIFSGPIEDDKFTHGTGCSFSSAICAFLTKNNDLITAIQKAKQFVRLGIKHGIVVGKGVNPINHSYNIS